MNIRELISVLTKLADSSLEFDKKQLFFVDRDNSTCDVENVQLLHDPVNDDVHLDLGGQYVAPTSVV